MLDTGFVINQSKRVAWKKLRERVAKHTVGRALASR